MDTKEVIIDDDIMEELGEISVRKGRSLEETIDRYAGVFNEANGYNLNSNVSDLEDFDEDYTEEFFMKDIEEETWKDIRKEAAQTGENPDTIAQRFVDFMNELALSHVTPPEIMEVRRQSRAFSLKKKYKAVV